MDMSRARSWTILTIRGVPLNVHVSLLFLLLYVLLIATAQFRLVAEQSGIEITQISGPPIIWGLVFALSLVASIAIHEFSHVFMAQRLGGKVRRVTLMMLGGVSEIEKLSDRPSVEFRVALIGPVTSLCIGSALLLMHAFSPSPNLSLYGFWLGQLNIVLAVFNLLPAFPTDGGRLLRAFLVSRQGRLRGTRNAVTVGKLFAWFFGLVGLLQLNILLILIAFFVYAGAQSELFMVEAHSALKGIRVRDLMREVPGLSGASTLREAADRMLANRASILPFRDSQTGQIGVVSADMLSLIPKEQWPATRLDRLGIESTRAISPDAELENLLDEGSLTSLATLPVLEADELKGILRISDLAEAIRLHRLAESAQT